MATKGLIYKTRTQTYQIPLAQSLQTWMVDKGAWVRFTAGSIVLVLEKSEGGNSPVAGITKSGSVRSVQSLRCKIDFCADAAFLEIEPEIQLEPRRVPGVLLFRTYRYRSMKRARSEIDGRNK